MDEKGRNLCWIQLPWNSQNYNHWILDSTSPHPDKLHHSQRPLRLALKDIILDANLAVELDPSLKTLQQEAKTNGDMFVPVLPPFKVYKIRISHRCDKLKVSTDIIGIKCAQEKAKLLKEFYTQLGSPTHYEKQIGVFVPTGAVHSLGSANYAKLLSDNNAFLQSIITIPIGNFVHETLDIPFCTEANTDIDQTTLLDVLMEQTVVPQHRENINPQQDPHDDNKNAPWESMTVGWYDTSQTLQTTHCRQNRRHHDQTDATMMPRQTHYDSRIYSICGQTQTKNHSPNWQKHNDTIDYKTALIKQISASRSFIWWKRIPGASIQTNTATPQNKDYAWKSTTHSQHCHNLLSCGALWL